LINRFIRQGFFRILKNIISQISAIEAFSE